MKIKDIRGVHHQAPEEIGPGKIIHGILLGGNSTSYNLSIHVVRQDL